VNRKLAASRPHASRQAYKCTIVLVHLFLHVCDLHLPTWCCSSMAVYTLLNPISSPDDTKCEHAFSHKELVRFIPIRAPARTHLLHISPRVVYVFPLFSFSCCRRSTNSIFPYGLLPAGVAAIVTAAHRQ